MRRAKNTMKTLQLNTTLQIHPPATDFTKLILQTDFASRIHNAYGHSHPLTPTSSSRVPQHELIFFLFSRSIDEDVGY